MKRPYLSVMVLFMGLAVWGPAWAQDITAFENGYATFDNPDTNLYYRIEFRPNLTGPEGWTNQLPTNIKTNDAAVTVPVGVFYRVAGSEAPWPVVLVAKTGQTTDYREGDDAWWSTNGVGAAWPDPRFVVQSDTNVVLDNLTGLMWTRDMNPDYENNHGWKAWHDAIDYCNTLGYGGYSDWRLPNITELLSLVDYTMVLPALSAGHPFTGFSNLLYGVVHYSSTVVNADTNVVWHLRLDSGQSVLAGRTHGYAWPVRAGR